MPEDQNEIVVPEDSGVLAHTDDAVVDFLTAPALQQAFLNLAQKSNKETEVTGIRPGQWFLSDQDKTKSVPVGAWETNGGKRQCSFKMLYIGWRPKAVLFKDGVPEFESYDPSSDLFKKIVNTQEGGFNQIRVNMGIETLQYIPPECIMVEEILQDSIRGLSEEDMPSIRKRYNNGIVCTFHWSRRNKEHTCGGPTSRGGIEPGTAVVIKSDMKEGKSYSWWEAPIRKTLIAEGEDREWIEYGQSLITDQLIRAFHNPQARGDSGESVESGGGETIESNR